MSRFGLLLVLLLTSNVSIAADISGFWQHPKDPVWIEVSATEGVGIALRNDDDPATVGFEVLKDVTAGTKEGVWVGEVFVPQLGDYKRVEVTLPNDDTLKMKVKIGFLSRSLEWSRVASVPQPPAD
tara:strand:+ start:265 stop:642 length:378 start_codon:yes stop_codon:yes gene_type:complete